MTKYCRFGIHYILWIALYLAFKISWVEQIFQLPTFVL